MNKFLLALLFVLLPVPALACVHSVASTDTYVEVCTASDACRRLDYVDIPRGSQAQKEEVVRQYLQDFIDVRLELNSFDPLDPAKAENPNCGNFYWGDADGVKQDDLDATYLIARSCIVEFVEWNGTQYKFTIRRADRCN